MKLDHKEVIVKYKTNFRSVIRANDVGRYLSKFKFKAIFLSVVLVSVLFFVNFEQSYTHDCPFQVGQYISRVNERNKFILPCSYGILDALLL